MNMVCIALWNPAQNHLSFKCFIGEADESEKNATMNEIEPTLLSDKKTCLISNCASL